MPFVACSTPLGTSGIAVVRLSGKNSFDIFKKITKTNAKPVHAVSKKYKVYDKKGDVFDEIVATAYLSPKTYTGENMVEISCHGNPVIISKVLEVCCSYGCTLAEPGEFTKTAFLNGKLDISEAEAVSDIIHAKSVEGVKLGIKNLGGGVSKRIKKIKASILSCLANIEFNLDISEEDLQPNLVKDSLSLVKKVHKKIEYIAKSFKSSSFLVSGASVVISGPPNAGKSTLFNRMVGSNRAIVTEIPGTTRDVVEKDILIDNIPINLKDTAGIRDSKDPVEKVGIKKSKEELVVADVVICLEEKPKKPKKNHIYVFNKIDLGPPSGEYDISISAKNGKNVEGLNKKISSALAVSKSGTEAQITTLRQLHLVLKAKKSLESARKHLSTDLSLELVAEELSQTISFLDMLTEKTTKDDVLDVVFSSFCVGK